MGYKVPDAIPQLSWTSEPMQKLRSCFNALSWNNISPPSCRMKVIRVVSDAGAFLEFLAAQKEVKSGSPVGLTGYCMGGGMVMRTAAHYAERVASAASFHGGRLATASPDSPHHLVHRITAELYFGHADQDSRHDSGGHCASRGSLAKSRTALPSGVVCRRTAWLHDAGSCLSTTKRPATSIGIAYLLSFAGL